MNSEASAATTNVARVAVATIYFPR
jgi:hypothetical protein